MYASPCLASALAVPTLLLCSASAAILRYNTDPSPPLFPLPKIVMRCACVFSVYDEDQELEGGLVLMQLAKGKTLDALATEGT